MKVASCAVLLLISLVTINALPARLQDEVEFIPLEERHGGQNPIVSTGVFGGDPWSSPFDGLFESLASMMTRMRQQMDYLLGRVPTGNSTLSGPFPGFPDLDLSKGNTTSVTKVIDGHKVVINETEYKHEGDHGGAFFKVRIIDVQPDSSELTTEKNAEEIPPKDAESVENSYENEIPKNREIEVINSFDQPDSVPSQKIIDRGSRWDKLETFNSVEEPVDYYYPPGDLSHDTYVNQIMADSNAPVNPDAEVFSSFEYNVPRHVPDRRQPFERIAFPR